MHVGITPAAGGQQAKLHDKMKDILEHAVLQGPLLEALSSYRYVAHSFAVVLSLVAAEQAARAGVHFADTLWFKGVTYPSHIS